MRDKTYEIVTNASGDLLWSGENPKGKWPGPGETFERNGQTFVVLATAYTKGRPGGFGYHSSAFVEMTVELANGTAAFPAPQKDVQTIVRIFDNETFAVLDAMIAQKVAEHFKRVTDAALLSGSAIIGGPEFVQNQERLYRADRYDDAGFSFVGSIT